ncbi:MAG TPA: sugar ABC transporter substrate-binding protein, partial [Mycobacterium sp.]|nr:sugar ABC transporter substrate-binding protein [Mycobacterium sp.]
MRRPRSSTSMLAALVAVALVLVAAAVVLGRTAQPSGRTVVTVRLWDQQVAAAYRESFAQFTHEHPDI